MKTLRLIFFVFLISQGCTEVIDDQDNNQKQSPSNETNFESLEIPADFNFETTQDLVLQVSSENIAEAVLYEFYYVGYNDEYKRFGKGLSDSQGNLNYTTTLPKHVDLVYVVRTTFDNTVTFEAQSLTNPSFIFDDSSLPFTHNASSNDRTNGVSATDTDSDGVIDSLDDYPNDATKAFNNFFPNEISNASVAFEDLYPAKGDYDFNDLTVDYNINLITNSANMVSQIIINCEAVVVEAGMTSGFAMQLPFDDSNISSVTGGVNSGSIFYKNAKGVENGMPSSAPNILIFDDSKAIVNPTSGGIYLSDIITVTVDLSTPISMAAAGTPPFNPFLIINKVREREVHLPGHSYTNKFNTDYLSAGEDVGDFKSVDGHPWGLHIPELFEPTSEGTDITDAYHFFQNFAESGGTTNTDWYLDNPGYRDDSKLVKSIGLE